MLTVAHLLNGILMIGMPLVLGVALTRRYRFGWRLFGMGAVTFIASQLLHLPFNALVLNRFVMERGLFAAGGVSFIVAALLYGLSAGVFEEGARYIVMRRWDTGERGVPGALMFGAGHGGAEAMILGGGVFINFLQAVALREADLSQLLPPEKVQATALQLAQYWGIPWYQALLGAVERAGALCFHLGASVLVFTGIRRSQLRWLGAAVAWHTLVNALALIVMDRWGFYAAEGWVIVGAALSLLIIRVLGDQEAARPLRAEHTIDGGQRPTADPRGSSDDLAEENLEDSRYL